MPLYPYSVIIKTHSIKWYGSLCCSLILYGYINWKYRYHQTVMWNTKQASCQGVACLIYLWRRYRVEIFILGIVPGVLAIQYKILSHTWVRNPGFSGHVVKCLILTTVVPGFPAIWLAVPFGANGAHLGICTLSEKILFCVWNKFLGEIKFSQRRTHPVKSLWWQIVPMQESTNEWKNLSIFGLVVHNGKTSNIEVPIDKINIEILEIFQILRNIARFNLKLFYQI